MSHSTVLVIGEDPEKMLEPYDENLEDVQMPRWDWYQLGGRWTGYYALKSGTEGEVGMPGIGASKAPPGRVDQARKRDIDFDSTHQAHAVTAEGEITKVLRALVDKPPLVSWARYRDEFLDEIAKARAAYHAQPGLSALSEAKLDVWGDDPVEFYCLRAIDPVAAYVAKESRGRMTPFAILDADGWHEHGEMGWFGVVHDEKHPDDWAEQVQRLIDAASDDALFSVYDVHI